MTTTTLVLLIGGIVGASLVFVVFLLGLLAVIFKMIRKKAQAIIDERFEASQVVRAEPGANYFGQQSKGAAQIRGNGALVLTDQVLWFCMIAPRRELEIPLEKITGVRFEKWFLGKTKGGTILVVDFEGPEGPDAAGWLVRDHEGWKAELLSRAT